MIKRTLCLVLYAALTAPIALASTANTLITPTKGVLCDQYLCADENGVSVKLTKKYLGDIVAKALTSQGDFDVTEFTFANKISCDTKVKKCYVDRYYNADGDGTRSAVDPKYTAELFGR